MSKVDIIVFGASGFTGEYIANELANIYSNKLTFALAGRTQAKLEKVNSKLSVKANKIIIADVKNQASLVEMCQQGKLLISAVGPYRFYGLQVMEAAVTAKCHYIDISGEPWFIESGEFKFDQQAKKNGVYAVSACGFDSIPSDMGVEFTRKEFAKKFGADKVLNEIQAYLGVGSDNKYGYTAHSTTLECAVHGFSTVKDLTKLRRETVKENPLVAPVGSKGRHRKDFHSPPDTKNEMAVKFPGSDRSIVLRSQQRIARNLKENVVQFFMYVTMNNTFMNKVKGFIVGGLVLGFLTKFSWGRNLIIRYPKQLSLGAFSHEGPTQQQMEHASFKIDFYGQGNEGERIRTRVMGPDPGYIGTAAMVCAAAVTLLEDKETLPKEGGVMTTAFAFRSTKIYERLNERGIKFSVV